MAIKKLTKVQKRDGRIVKFDREKIENAIWKAAQTLGGKDRKAAEELSYKVVELVKEETPAGKTPTVEQVQDIVEKILIEEGHVRTAKCYILYRQKRAEIRRAKSLLGVQDDLKLSLNAITVLEKRYLMRDEHGRVIETPRQMFERVAKAVASAEKRFKTPAEERKELEKEFFRMMSTFEFLPNSPTLMNAGTGTGLSLSACFVLPVEDSIVDIFEAIKNMAIIHQSGGGTGFTFTHLRPAGDVVKKAGGVASGPISFMKAFNAATEIIKQGGCISANSLVRTNSGVLPIGNLLNCSPLGQNFTKHLVYDGKMFSNAFISMDNGIADVFKFNTNIGLSIESTYNHQLACVDENGEIVWRDSQQIKEGDWLVVVVGGHNGNDVELPRIEKQHFNANPIKIPKRMTSELGEILGLYMADGCLSTGGRLVFSVENKDWKLMNRIEYLMNSVFGLKVGTKKDNDTWTDMFFYSYDLKRFFEKMDWKKKSSPEAFIPGEIFVSSREVARAFVRGLFEGDGDVHFDGYPRLYSTSGRLIEQVQQLLLGLNIVSSYHKYEKGENSFGKRPIFQLTIAQDRSIKLFMNEIGFITKRKNETLKKRYHEKEFEQNDIIPNQGKNLKSLYNYVGRGSGKGRSKRGAERKFYRAIYHYISDAPSSKRNLTRKRLSKLMEEFSKIRDNEHFKMISDPKYYFTKVKKIEKTRSYTMDIEVPGSGKFVANGILVHNKRRGANMGILRVDHPDILDFIVCKETEGVLNNFNISVALTDKFMKAVEEDKDFELVNPRGRWFGKKVKARAIWNLIITMAWKNGEPGVIFIDRINKANPTPELGNIESTNPCGEQPLLPYESCNLGSINIGKMVSDEKINWDKLRHITRLATRFLDNVIEINKFPLKELDGMNKKTRKIGLGVMGFADMLIGLVIPYNSEEGVKTAEKVMKFIRDEGRKMSEELGKKRGSFEAFKGSVWDKKGYKYMRNATITTVAPTGTIGVISGCSQGCEPLFAISYVRNVQETIGANLIYVDSKFEARVIMAGIYNDELMRKITMQSSIQDIKEIPEDIKKVFVTAHDISPEWHVRMQAAFQKYTDNAVSKTINFPNHATPDDVEKAYKLAYDLGCKGLTVYRDGSRKYQILTTKSSKKDAVSDLISSSGGCDTCGV